MSDAEYNICFDLNLHSLTIQVKFASCVSEACDVIFAFVLRLKVQLHIQLLKMRSKYFHGICHWNAELSLRLSTNAYTLCKWRSVGNLNGAYQTSQQTPIFLGPVPERRNKLYQA